MLVQYRRLDGLFGYDHTLAGWLVMDLDSSLHRVSSAFGVLIDVVQP